MRRFIFGIALAAVCCGCLISCNEKPKHYRFVKQLYNGKEEVEEINAKNDTDALKQYFSQMEKIIVESLDKPESGFKAMYVISPDGDTLNKDEALMKAIVKPDPIEIIRQMPTHQIKNR